MSLKRRNLIAFFLILFAAVSWTFGQRMLDTTAAGYTSDATVPATEAYYSEQTVPQERVQAVNSQSNRIVGMILTVAAAIAGIIAIFALSQKNPVFGPDGICLVPALSAVAYHISLNIASIFWGSSYQSFALLFDFLCSLAVLLSARELVGWIIARFSLSWCLVQRIALLCTAPQLSLLVFIAWIMLPLAAFACFWGAIVYAGFWICAAGFLAASAFGFLCLWKYGSDLNHFKKQLNNYQNGKPITVSDGAFTQTEAQLLAVQAQHEEAVRTAITSERFKVELISNVSHDLRTPLTSILGYSELLQNETLSPAGQEQLRRLHQKAGYMNDLVDSLFELTKVSSGVAESKKEQIDLVRLLEQTIGLFDDQLVNAGLIVKRNYFTDKIPAITD